MTNINRKRALLCSVMMMGCTNLDGNDVATLDGPYLGQTPPGMVPKAFAPGLVNTENWGDSIGFSADMNTIFVHRWRHTHEVKDPESEIYKKVDNRWRKSVLPAGTRKPQYSPDGNVMYFGAQYQERTADGWSELKSLGPKFDEIRIMGLKSSAKGTLVLDENARHNGGHGILRYSRLIDGTYEDPKPLPKTINTGMWNAHPFIAPDESYIMWDGIRESGYGEADLYISFRLSDGSWGDAINLGEQVNTDAEEGGPSVTPDGKYLFFNRMVLRKDGSGQRQSDIYWVDAQIIENLRPK
ncbi:hypothetical protein HG263_12125 [Pseudoalteromonas sp. JBTF-M23]|uniref:WD40 repeat protein n=1 Tax=Pseudoalteromonas caenipelagi TaxID=2726988 RepID=A0A849VDT5_9GAMM|nr:PD40 domain-containing protein [Pseudoalteromonas caenipelagi]NOU51275.1 hypothetical protein [Pseudoalteromonas caenipelagi]